MAGNMKEKYETLSAVVLRDLAKSRGIPRISRMKKSELIDAMLHQDELDAEAAAKKEEAPEEKEPEKNAVKPDTQKEETAGEWVSSDETEEKQSDSSPKQGRRKVTSKTSPKRSGEKKNRPSKADQGSQKNEEENQKDPTSNKSSHKKTESRHKNSQDNAGTQNRRKNHQPENNNNGKRTENGRKDRKDTKARAAHEEAHAHKEENHGRRENNPHTEEPLTREEIYHKRQEEKAERQAERDEKAAEEISQYKDAREASGILEVLNEGYGFIRSDNYMPGDNDVYVSPSQIRRFNMRTGDIISGKTRKNNPNDKFGALLFVESMNGENPDVASKRKKFEDMIPIFPDERIRLEYEGCSPAMRIVDLFSPIGKGQRGMIVSQPKAGKTTLLKEVAKSVKLSHPDMHIIVLLIDERPEEVTDMKESIEGGNVEVIYSTFDELPEHHKRVSEMTIERAKRLVEQGKDVMILLDSITRLARAYNLTVPPSGRTLSGGLDPAALHMPKRFFGAARNMRGGGSLTILATALVNTGSKMDDVVYEEFKGTGNMELILDRKMSERRIFPAIDLTQSSTRRDDLLLSREERAAMDIVRKGLNSMRRDDATEQVLNMLTHTRNNNDLVRLILKRRIL